MLGSFGQIAAHVCGDYVFQSDWMANNKTKKSLACLAHVSTYFLPFLLITTNPTTLAIIVVTHYIIDRWRLARYVVWAKNFIAPSSYWPPSFEECKATGYPPTTPAWLATWLMIIVDNLMHVAINAWAIERFG
jgi:hypothetical protein